MVLADDFGWHNIGWHNPPAVKSLSRPPVCFL
jgi:hypothetical protein